MRYTLHTVVAVAMSLMSLVAHAQQPTEPQQQEEQVLLQQTADFIQHLAEPDSLSGARSKVTIHFSAEEAIGKYDTSTQPTESYQGYRIRIFSSNSQTARTDAEAAIALFEENYSVPVYFAYENPYFLVTCGNCLSHEEAIILLSKVRIHFPKAFIVMSEIPAEALTTKPLPKPQPQQSEEGEVATDGETTEQATPSTFPETFGETL